MTNRIAILTLGVLTACAFTAAGCKKDDQPANSANNMQPGYGQPGYGQPTQPGYGQPTQPGSGQPTAAPAAPAAPPAANPLGALAGMLGGLGGGAPPGGTAAGGSPAPGGTTAAGPEVANNGAMAAAGGQVLVPLQQQNAPGSRQVGEALAGNLQQGQFIKTAVQLQPGKCYTGIGQGSGGPVQVEIVAQVGNLAMAQSRPAILSILGDRPNCFKHPGLPPVPLPVFFRVVAQGTGPVTAALYEK